MHKKLNYDSWLGAKNPAIKFFLLIIVTFCAGFIFDIGRLTAMWGLAFIGFYFTSHFTIWQLIKMQKPFFGVAAIVFMVNLISRQGEISARFLFFTITNEGLLIGTALALRTLFIGVLSLAFMKTTCPIALMISLNQHAKLSIKVSYAIMTGFRIVERLSHDWQMILVAHRMRQPHRVTHCKRQKVKTLFARVNLYKSALLTLLIFAIRMAERIAFTLETRGLGLSPMTRVKSIPLTLSDLLFAGFVLTTFVFLMLFETAVAF